MPLIGAGDIVCAFTRRPADGLYVLAVRVISQADYQVLAAATIHQPTLKQVALYPEDEFEARLIHGDAARLNIA